METIANFSGVYAALKDWASRLHAQQGQTQWADGKPYRAHLEAVEEVLTRFGFDDMANPINQVLRLSAWAHDLLEDTNLSLTTLRVMLGRDVEALVWAVTDEPGETRAERHTNTYQKIAATPWATVLKLGDRISNVEASIHFGPERFLKLYRDEQRGFREALYVQGQPEEAMWAWLEGLLKAHPDQPVQPVRTEAPIMAAPLVAIQQSLFD